MKISKKQLILAPFVAGSHEQRGHCCDRIRGSVAKKLDLQIRAELQVRTVQNRRTDAGRKQKAVTKTIRKGLGSDGS